MTFNRAADQTACWLQHLPGADFGVLALGSVQHAASGVCMTLGPAMLMLPCARGPTNCMLAWPYQAPFWQRVFCVVL